MGKLRLLQSLDPLTPYIKDKSMSQLQKSEDASVARIFIIIGVVWTIVISGFFAREIRESQNYTNNLALHQGRSFFQEITTTRSWNALHGGVYVPVSESVQPNPYLWMCRTGILSPLTAENSPKSTPRL